MALFGSVNINTSRRNYFIKCYLYENKDSVPIGVFFARYVNGKSDTLQLTGQVLQDSETRIIIETQDNIKIKPNQFVLLGDDMYIIESSIREAINKNTQFMRVPYYITTITLKGYEYIK